MKLVNSIKMFVRDEEGQDLIEYALLASFLGFAAMTAVTLLGAAMKSSYAAWDAAGQTDTMVDVPDPKSE